MTLTWDDPGPVGELRLFRVVGFTGGRISHRVQVMAPSRIAAQSVFYKYIGEPMTRDLSSVEVKPGGNTLNPDQPVIGCIPERG